MIKKLSTTQKVFLGIFLITAFIYCFNVFKEPDSFYHLKAGQIILEGMSIPRVDPFSFVSGGAEWIPHEWLSEVILFGSYKLAGYFGVISLVAILGTLTSLILLTLCLKKGVNFYLSIVGILVLNALTFELWIGRPQVFSYLFVALFIYLLEKFREDGKTGSLLLLGLLTLAWANMHAGFILGIAIVFAYLAGGIVNHRLKLVSALDMVKLKKLAYLLLSLPLISLLNPSGYKIFTYSSVILPAVKKLRISEWYPITDFLYLSETKIYLVQILLFGIFGLAWFLSKKERRDFIPTFLFLGVCYLPFISIRHIGFWPVALIPFVLEATQKFILDKVESRFGARDFGIASAIVLLAFITPKVFSFPKKYYNPNTVPVGAAEFIKKEGLRGPLFNVYNDGGFMIWNLYPEKIFIDGRSEVYSLDKIDDYLAITGGAPHWKKLVDDKYKLEYFLVAYRMNPEGLTPMIANLEKEGWKLVYWDDLSVVYVRNDAQNREVINKYALELVGPFRNASKLSSEDKKKAFKELKDVLERVENSQIIQEYARILMSKN